MKLKYLYFSPTLLLSLILFSCGKIEPKGQLERKDFKLENFHSIDLNGVYKASWVPSDQFFINIETYPNILKNLDFQVEDSILTIQENRGVEKVDFYHITIYSPHNLKKITISDSVELSISGKLKTQNLDLIIKNNAKFIGDLQTLKTNLDMAQTSRANIIGRSDFAQIKIADTANFIAPFWLLKNLQLDSKNANYAEVNVADSLKGKISHTAKLVYYNNPVQALKIDKTTTVNQKKIP